MNLPFGIYPGSLTGDVTAEIVESVDQGFSWSRTRVGFVDVGGGGASRVRLSVVDDWPGKSGGSVGVERYVRCGSDRVWSSGNGSSGGRISGIEIGDSM
ncbi:hypothetical protein CA951_18000 [Rhodococcus sp. NCIMB 12038]|nr:hypothetical protein CA951_18000 [Rhodococcus sp. NCIMB 12038]